MTTLPNQMTTMKKLNKQNDSKINSLESKEEKKSQTPPPEPKSTTRTNNLSVEDVELGKLLNQI